jgi:hypothetical protein
MKIIIIVFFLLFSRLASAAESSNVTANASTSTAQPSTSEVGLLRQEVVLLRSFQDNILKIVIYTLSTVGGVALLLVGYNWWSANKIYERDKNALKEDILNTQKQGQLDFETKITRQVTSSLGSMNERIQHFETSISEKVSSGLSTVESKYLHFSQDISGKVTDSLSSTEGKYLALRNETTSTVQQFRSELDSQLRSFIKTSVGDLDARLSGNVSESVKELNSKVSDLRRKLLFQEESLNNRIGADQEEGTLWSSAYTSYFKALEAAVELDWEYGIDRALDNLIRALNNGAQLLTSEKRDVLNLVGKMPDKYKQKTDILVELANKAPIWKAR